MTVVVGLQLPEIGNLHDLLLDGSTTDQRVRCRLKLHPSLTRLNPCRWRIASGGNRMEAVAVSKIQHSKPSFANPRGAREHDIKDRLKFAGRTGDDLQNFRSRGLLLQRL